MYLKIKETDGVVHLKEATDIIFSHKFYKHGEALLRAASIANARIYGEVDDLEICEGDSIPVIFLQYTKIKPFVEDVNAIVLFGSVYIMNENGKTIDSISVSN